MRFEKWPMIGTGIVLANTTSFAYAADQNQLDAVPLGTLTAQLYTYALNLVGLCVFLMFVLAGLTMIIPGMKKSFGEPSLIIKNAVIGLVILASAYVVLNAISPDLVKFSR